ncbi:hypothetical protein HanPSC8_Chr04g0179401 [Helianthus annuus]|nr:hypothetical protein HanPSC8_Chr04g0179401 [Helianthus annuus]
MQQERKRNRTHAVHSARARSASCVVGIASQQGDSKQASERVRIRKNQARTSKIDMVQFGKIASMTTSRLRG